MQTLNNLVSIVMYHYVRPLTSSAFPRLKALDVDGFRRQVRYLKDRFVILGFDEFSYFLDSRDPDGRAKALLTFDDGFRDHLNHVLPILIDEGLSACFYPTAAGTEHKKVLEVHKIHFITAANGDHQALLARLAGLPSKPITDSNYGYGAGVDAGKRLDPPSTLSLKRLLQRDLADGVRSAVIDSLFAQFVTTDEKAFAEELYMGLQDLRTLETSGMHLGGHTATHPWLSSLPTESQRDEVRSSRALISSLSTNTQKLNSFAYPFGDYDSRTLAVLQENGYEYAFTTRVGTADLTTADKLQIPRLDTIDFPS